MSNDPKATAAPAAPAAAKPAATSSAASKVTAAATTAVKATASGLLSLLNWATLLTGLQHFWSAMVLAARNPSVLVSFGIIAIAAYLYGHYEEMTNSAGAKVMTASCQRQLSAQTSAVAQWSNAAMACKAQLAMAQTPPAAPVAPLLAAPAPMVVAPPVVTVAAPAAAPAPVPKHHRKMVHWWQTWSGWMTFK